MTAQTGILIVGNTTVQSNSPENTSQGTWESMLVQSLRNIRWQPAEVACAVCRKSHMLEDPAGWNWKTERQTHSKHSTSGKLQGTFIRKRRERKKHPPYSQHHFTLVSPFVLVLFIHYSFVSWIEPVHSVLMASLCIHCTMHCQTLASSGHCCYQTLHYCMFPTPSDTE